MKKLVQLLAFVVTIYFVTAQDVIPDIECRDCDVSLCPSIEHCRNGVKKDKCNCCDVCVKLEGHHCGGPRSQKGICADGLVCNIRHPMSAINLLEIEKYGKCETKQCESVMCGLHQWCRLDDNGRPECYCHQACHKIEAPVCGRKNSKQYVNTCELKREECLIQKIIGMDLGRCRECIDPENGDKINNGDVSSTTNLCETRQCRNGKLRYVLDDKCLEEKGFNCSKQSRHHKKILCKGERHRCEIVRESPDGKFPALGKCQGPSPDYCRVKDGRFETNETFIHPACSKCICKGNDDFECGPLCPRVNERITCADDAVQQPVPTPVSKKSHCQCLVNKCFKRSDICKFPPVAGPCFAYFRRYHYDHKDGRCKLFVFGGCKGNGNNFRTQHDCEVACAMRGRGEILDVDGATFSAIDLPAPPAKISLSTSKKMPAAPLKLSNKNMKVFGKIKFSGKEARLPESSCLKISLRDVTFKESRLYVLANKTYDMSNHSTLTVFPYELITKFPILDGSHNMFALNALVYIGRCPDISARPTEQDYLSDVLYPVNLLENANNNQFEVDVTLHSFAQGPWSIPGYDVGAHEKPKLNETPKDKIDNSEDGEEFLKKIMEWEQGGLSLFRQKDSSYLDRPLHDMIRTFGTQCVNKKETPSPGNQTMRVKGKISFPRPTGRLPFPSCLRIKLADVSLQGAPSVLIKEIKIDVSKKDVGTEYQYELETKKPIAWWKDYAISATLNKGWCKAEGEKKSIKEGDYWTDTNFRVDITEEGEEYLKDISVVCSGKCREDGIDNEEHDDLPISEPEEENTWPWNQDGYEEGFPEQPKLSNTTMRISGKITFSEPTGKLPFPSCLRIKLADISLQDAPSVLNEEIQIDISNQDIGTEYRYELETKKPIAWWRDYAIRAVLNKGWCKQEGEDKWLKKGDYNTDASFRVPITEEGNNFVKDFFVTCYECKTEVLPLKLSDETPKDKIDNSEDGKEFLKKIMEWEQGGLSNQTMRVKGKISFPRPTGRLPFPSCLRIKLADVSLQGAPSVLIKEIKIDVSKKDVGTEYQYELETKKPIAWWKDYAISATLNKGWCKAEGEKKSIKEGDYWTDTNFRVDITEEGEEYLKDISVVCSGKCREDGIDNEEHDDLPISEPEEENTWPWNQDGYEEGFPEQPKLSNKTMKVSGKILFPGPISKLPVPSCLRIKLKDTTLQDVPSIGIKEMQIDVSGQNIGTEYQYELETKKPIELWREYAVDAVLNKGWCKAKDQDQWVRPGDYLTDTSFHVDITDSEDSFVKDFSIICYECEDDAIEKDVDSTILEPLSLSTCSVGDQVYTEGEIWPKDICTDCKCESGRVHCFIDCPEKRCLSPKVPVNIPDDCCPICNYPETMKCFDEVTLQKYTHGEHFQRDACTSCECHNGTVTCLTHKCAPTECSNPEIAEGECCPKCPELKGCYEAISKKTYRNGEVYSKSACVKCGCYDGDFYCVTSACAPPPCPDGDLISVSEICCPVCSTSTICKDEKLGTFIEGNYWQNDKCLLCECTIQGIQCQTPNTDFESCSDVVVLSPSCGKICLPRRREYEEPAEEP